MDRQSYYISLFSVFFQMVESPENAGKCNLRNCCRKTDLYFTMIFWYLRYEARALFAKESSERACCYIKIFWHLCFDLLELFGSYPETTGCCCQLPATFLIALITFAKSLYEDVVMFQLTGVSPPGMRY